MKEEEINPADRPADYVTGTFQEESLGDSSLWEKPKNYDFDNIKPFDPNSIPATIFTTIERQYKVGNEIVTHMMDGSVTFTRGMTAQQSQEIMDSLKKDDAPLFGFDPATDSSVGNADYYEFDSEGRLKHIHKLGFIDRLEKPQSMMAKFVERLVNAEMEEHKKLFDFNIIEPKTDAKDLITGTPEPFTYWKQLEGKPEYSRFWENPNFWKSYIENKEQLSFPELIEELRKHYPAAQMFPLTQPVLEALNGFRPTEDQFTIRFDTNNDPAFAAVNTYRTKEEVARVEVENPQGTLITTNNLDGQLFTQLVRNIATKDFNHLLCQQNPSTSSSEQTT